MDFQTGAEGQEQALIALFETTFTASEGPEEGALIGALVRGLLTTTPLGELFVFTAVEDGRIVGSALFSRLAYADDPRRVLVMAPVAVATDRQGEGIGQGLIRHALACLKEAGVDVVMVYGDPAFYCRTGFAPISEAEAAAPHPLGQPQGWQAVALGGGPVAPLKGPSRCVPALDDPALW